MSFLNQSASVAPNERVPNFKIFVVRHGPIRNSQSVAARAPEVVPCTTVRDYCSKPSYTPRVDALPKEFDLLTGNRAITALAEGRTLADAQHDLHRHCRCPLWYARPHTVGWWDEHARKSPTPARVLTMLLAATCANAYAFVSSRACAVVRGTARRVRLLLANPRHGRCILLWQRRRRRRRRLRTTITTPKRPQGDLRTTNRQDSTDAPAMAASSVSRHQEINFFDPQ
jgi:hypothetical protein